MEYIRELFRTRPPLAVVQAFLKIIPMVLRGLWWRLWLKHARGLLLVGKGVVFRNPQHISVKKDLVAEDYAEIQGLSKEGIRFGEHVTIGRFAMIRPSGYYGRGIGEGMDVGDYSNIGPYCFIGCSGKIVIGRNVLMGPRVSLLAENHNFDRVDIPIRSQGVTRRSVVIEDDCWLGIGSVVLAGVRIGKRAVVAAGAVVTKDVPPYAIVAGVPARVVGWRRPPDQDASKENSGLVEEEG